MLVSRALGTMKAIHFEKLPSIGGGGGEKLPSNHDAKTSGTQTEELPQMVTIEE